jgi:hypothetical protein
LADEFWGKKKEPAPNGAGEAMARAGLRALGILKLFGSSKVIFGAENKNRLPQVGRRGGVSGGDAVRALGTTQLFGRNYTNKVKPAPKGSGRAVGQ